jgi:ribosomal protein L7/L12
MNSARVLKDDVALVRDVTQMLRTDSSEEQVVEHLRQLGLDKLDSIKVLRSATGMSLGQAKKTVHCSEAWADRREADDAFHEAAFAAAKELGFVEVVPSHDDKATPQ